MSCYHFAIMRVLGESVKWGEVTVMLLQTSVRRRGMQGCRLMIMNLLIMNIGLQLIRNAGLSAIIVLVL